MRVRVRGFKIMILSIVEENFDKVHRKSPELLVSWLGTCSMGVGVGVCARVQVPFKVKVHIEKYTNPPSVW